MLFVHGSPGGCDQGALMGAFLVERGYRVVAPSRPGYLGTSLDDTNRTPDQQADLHVALMDELDIDRFSVLCWSGGGASTYRLAARHPDRVARVGALAPPASCRCVSKRTSALSLPNGDTLLTRVSIVELRGSVASGLAGFDACTAAI